MTLSPPISIFKSVKRDLRLQTSQFRLVNNIVFEMSNKSELLETKKYIQHRDTTVFEHSISVSLLSLRIAQFFNIQVDKPSLIRGALFHDYFMYDWHDKEFDRPKWHAFRHPNIAYKNACKIWNLNSIETDIIKNHMFPVTLKFPKTKEGNIVSIADKICTLLESWNLYKFGNLWKKRKAWTGYHGGFSTLVPN